MSRTATTPPFLFSLFGQQRKRQAMTGMAKQGEINPGNISFNPRQCGRVPVGGESKLRQATRCLPALRCGCCGQSLHTALESTDCLHNGELRQQR